MNRIALMSLSAALLAGCAATPGPDLAELKRQVFGTERAFARRRIVFDKGCDACAREPAR